MDFVAKSGHLPKEVKRAIAKTAKSYRFGQEEDPDALIDFYYIELFFAEGIIDRREAEILAMHDLQDQQTQGGAPRSLNPPQ